MLTTPAYPSRTSGHLRLVLLTDGMFPYFMGGMQRHSRALAEHLAREHVDVTVYHTAYSDAAIAQARAGEDRPADPWSGIDVRFVEYPAPGRYPGHYIRDCRRYSEALLAAYRRDDPRADFIYAQGLTGLAFVEDRRAGRSLPPVGINAHGYPMFQRPAGLRGRLDQILLRPVFRRISRNADFVFTFGGKVREIVEHRLGVSAARILEVPNAVDDRWIVGSPRPSSSPRRFLFVGRHDRVKGLAELHAALATIAHDHAEFHFIGPIPERHRLRRHTCVYHGSVTETHRLQDLFDAADVLVCPSHAEGMPTVILEAMARGLAIIATDVGAVRTIVSAANGVLLPVCDSSAIAEAVTRIQQISPERLLSMKAASLAAAPRFGWRSVARQTVEAIDRAIGRS